MIIFCRVDVADASSSSTDWLCFGDLRVDEAEDEGEDEAERVEDEDDDIVKPSGRKAKGTKAKAVKDGNPSAIRQRVKGGKHRPYGKAKAKDGKPSANRQGGQRGIIE